MGVAPLIVTANDTIVKFLLPVHMILCFDDGGVLFPKGEVLPMGETKMFPLNWKLTLPPGHFGLLMPLNQQANGIFIVLAG